MASDGPETAAPRPTVFLSYASEDRQIARLIGDTLPGYGLEVWYDESELGGGEAWDQKIRKQIRECDYFMAIVSAQTEARHEGYFRREWRLAVERTLDMADDHLFLLPVVIDDTNEAVARVPEKFLTVQWLKVPGGRATPALEALCRRLVSGGAPPSKPAKEPAARPLRSGAPSAASAPARLPEFPREEAGQKVRFWVEVLVWVLRSGWALFQQLPRWIRILVIAWLVILAMSRGCVPHHESADRSSAGARKLQDLAQHYQGSSNPADAAKIAAQVAQEFSGNASASATEPKPLLAIPFAATSDNADANKLASAAFAQMYGRIAMSHHGQLALSPQPLPSCDLATVLQRGSAVHAKYVICGTIDTQASPRALTVSVASVADGSVHWLKSYPVADAAPDKIAAEVNEKLPDLDDD
jgi:hypothetical protein